MNIQKIVSGQIRYNYLDRVKASLSARNLTFNDLKTHERVGRSNHNVPDTIYMKKFGKTAKLPEHQNVCLCGHAIVEQCYLCPTGSNNVDDIIVVGNHCIKRFGFSNAVNGDASKKIQCDLCGALVCKKGIARHKRTPRCINNRKINDKDNDTESTKSGNNISECIINTDDEEEVKEKKSRLAMEVIGPIQMF